MSKFNVRVYGILFDEMNRVLISDEYEHRTSFTKFPGGGLEYGEGTLEALKREFIEECALPIEVTRHIYTTDFFVRSAFNDTQVLSIYYEVRALEKPSLRISTVKNDFQGEGEVLQAFRWVPLEELKAEDMTFDTEKYVVNLLKKKN